LLLLYWLVFDHLLTVKVWPLICKATKILRDFFTSGKTVKVLALNALLFLIFPLAVHHTNLEVISPIGLENVLLAVRTLLIVRPVLLFFLWLANVVLNDLHVRV